MRRDWLILPNLITLVRIAAAPLFFWMLLQQPDRAASERWFVVLIFVAAIATDGLDGAIARKRNLVTDLGKLLDPIADKVLIGAALVGLVLVERVDWWIAALILLREVGITVYRMLVIRDRVIPASAGGKVKTVLQAVTFALLLSPLDTYWTGLVVIEQIAIYLTLLVTLVTGFNYLRVALRETTGR